MALPRAVEGMVCGRITRVEPTPTAVDSLGEVEGLVIVGLPAGDGGDGDERGDAAVRTGVEPIPTRVGVAGRRRERVPTPTPADSAGSGGSVETVPRPTFVSIVWSNTLPKKMSGSKSAS